MGFLLLLDVILELLVQDGAPADLCSAEVDQLQVAILGEHNVFGLEVPMGDADPVQVLQHVDDLGDVEPPELLGEVAVVEAHEVGEVAPVAVLQHVVEVLAVLVALHQPDDARVVDLPQQLLLHERLVLLALLGQLLLLDLLDGVQLGAAPGQGYSPVGALADVPHYLVVLAVGG